MDYNIEHIDDWYLSPEQEVAIADLLETCFPGYPVGRSFYRTRPVFRYLALDNNIIIGHCGVDFRTILIGSHHCTIFGIIDLCIHPNYRNSGASKLLMKTLIEYSRHTTIDYIFSFSGEASFYKKFGFIQKDIVCKWLLINNNRSLGIVNRRLIDCVFILPVNSDIWDEEEVDLLGSIF